jgi:chaperonin cofactor prefoldin
MELMTSRWTDDRMDDLKSQVDELGRRVEEGFAGQRGEMNARFDRMESMLDARFAKVDERFEKVETRFEARFEKIDERFEKVDARFEKVDARFETIDDRFNRTQEMIIGLHATLSRVSVAFALAMAGLVIAQVA